MLSLIPNKKIKNSVLQKFVIKGKKQIAEALFFKLIKTLCFYKKISNTALLNIFETIKPIIFFRSVKLRGTLFKVPFFLKEKEQEKIMFTLFFKQLKGRFIEFLSKEIFQFSFKQGSLLKKRNDFYKISNQNKVFAQYRWF